eukprot:Nk52_evm16s2355 gene=Nk52_evmTU16s2355
MGREPGQSSISVDIEASPLPQQGICLAQCQELPLHELQKDFHRKISRPPSHPPQMSSNINNNPAARQTNPVDSTLSTALNEDELNALAEKLGLSDVGLITSKLTRQVNLLEQIPPMIGDECGSSIKEEGVEGKEKGHAFAGGLDSSTTDVEWITSSGDDHCRPLFHENASVNFPVVFKPILQAIAKINTSLERIRNSNMFRNKKIAASDGQQFQSHLQQERAYLQTIFCTGMVGILIFSAFYSVFLTVFEVFYSAITSYSFLFLMTMCLVFTLKRGTEYYETSVNMTLFFFCAVFVAFPAFSGGVIQSGYLTAGGALVPVWAIICLQDNKAALRWFIVVNIGYLGMFLCEYYGLWNEYDLYHQIPKWMDQSDYELMLGYFSYLAFTVTLLSWTAFSAVRTANANEESRILLSNILPYSIQNELQNQSLVSDQTLLAHSYDSVSIFFCDMVSFTTISSRMPPAKLVQALNHIFMIMDNFTSDFGVEKIKTIGDSYMAACGLFENEYEKRSHPEFQNDDKTNDSSSVKPHYEGNHAQRMTKFCITVRDEIKKLNMQSCPFRMRYGIHTGPVVAGVIGSIKFQFDVWGDTVNIASRMESTGIKDNCHVSEPHSIILKGRFILYERGEIEVKGKGLMRTYIVLDEREKPKSMPNQAAS